MHFIDILNLSLSSLGIYDFIFSLRYLIPCYIIPCLSADLNKTLQLLNHAEAIHAIPPESEYKTNLDLYQVRIFILIVRFLILYTDAVRRTNLRRCGWRAIMPRGFSSNCALLFSVA